MEKAAFILRSIEPDDIAGAMKLSNDEGWNQTEKDWKLLTENPQSVSLLAEDNKKIIGTTTAINYSNQIAWIGMVLVDKDYRGQGISKSLLINIFKKLDSFKSIKLDATSEGQRVYKKFDFKDEYFISRMTIASMENLSHDNNGIAPELIHENDISGIIALDECVFGANRQQLIKSLIKEYPHKAWVLKQNDCVTGFALGRDGNKYHQIGPVVASSTGEAKALIIKALDNLINQPIVVDVLSDKENLINWLSSIGFINQRNFIRMYKKQNPFPGVTDKQYLICGPEFG
jgi:predicted N-acetyltransferase YhbS